MEVPWPPGSPFIHKPLLPAWLQPVTSQPYATSVEQCSVPTSQVTHYGAQGFPHLDSSAYQAEDSFLLGYPVSL